TASVPPCPSAAQPHYTNSTAHTATGLSGRSQLNVGHSCALGRTRQQNQMSKHPLIGNENRRFVWALPSWDGRQRFEPPSFRPLPLSSKSQRTARAPSHSNGKYELQLQWQANLQWW